MADKAYVTIDLGADGSVEFLRGTVSDFLEPRKDKQKREFECIACRREIEPDRWDHLKKERWQTFAPFCRNCEYDWALGIGKPTGGTPMDRRHVMRIAVLSELLRCEAAKQKWSHKYAN